MQQATTRVFWVATLVLSGCGYFNTPGSTTTGQTAGFTAPTLEITVGGVRFGPATPDSGSSAQLVDQYDASTNALLTSTLTLNATVTSLGISCSTSVERIGNTLMPTSAITASAYQIADDLTGQTADGAVDVTSAPTVVSSGVAVSCAGSSCDGFGISLTALDSTVAEGYLSGTLSDAQGDATDVVCSFYLPVTTYQP